jgi:hypothetical protein
MMFDNGAEAITDTNAHTGRFCAVYFYEASTISAISAEDITGNSLANEQFPADSYLYGTITSITLSGGAAIAYRL